MSSILAVVESFNGGFKKSAWEVISYAKALAEKQGSDCIALVFGVTNEAGKLGVHGTDKVLHVNKEISMADNQSIVKFIAGIAESNNATAIILSHNSSSKGLIGRLAIRLDSGCASAVISLPDLTGGDFVVSRSVFAGKAIAQVRLKGKCKILSITSGVVPLKTDGNEIAIEALEIAHEGLQVHSKEIKRISGKTPLPEAELVVSAGRGLKGPENWGMVEELAEVLGATTACSRPVADSHWRPHHEHVGQTGIAIKPKLYIALGISGAIQHLAGVNNSKVIVVINKDPEAPFFKAADYGIVGDLFEVVPRLTEAIKKIKAG